MKIFAIFILLTLCQCQKSKSNLINDAAMDRTTYILSGRVIWEHDDLSGVKDVIISLSGPESLVDTTDSNGEFSFTVSTLGSYTLIPVKNINLLNGVAVDDGTTIQKHLTLIQLITDPYKRIAADANKDNRISTVDAVIIKQAVNGNPTALNYLNPSWKFVDAAFLLALPPNNNDVPTGYPEIISVTITGDTFNLDFIGIKRGDVNGTANPAN